MTEYEQNLEIGGYFGLEAFTGTEYHQNCLRMNLGRTALIYLARQMKLHRLYVPRLLCDSVTTMCRREGLLLEYYSLDAHLMPLQISPMKVGEALLLVNYLGQLTDEKILAAKERYHTIIVDHTHSFFQRPLPQVPTFYSCRKFFGLPDGAYLYSPNPSMEKLPQDHSANRMSHILGRWEDGAFAHYQEMHQIAASFYQEKPKQMSRLTQNLLHGIPYENVKNIREKNAGLLDDLLGNRNLLNRSPKSQKLPLASFVMPQGPLAYPLYHPQGIRLRKALAEKKIYVPTYWTNVAEQNAPSTVEYQCAANILPLPCDQRYTAAQMEFLAKTILELWEEISCTGYAS